MSADVMGMILTAHQRHGPECATAIRTIHLWHGPQIAADILAHWRNDVPDFQNLLATTHSEELIANAYRIWIVGGPVCYWAAIQMASIGYGRPIVPAKLIQQHPTTLGTTFTTRNGHSATLYTPPPPMSAPVVNQPADTTDNSFEAPQDGPPSIVRAARRVVFEIARDRADADARLQTLRSNGRLSAQTRMAVSRARAARSAYSAAVEHAISLAGTGSAVQSVRNIAMACDNYTTAVAVHRMRNILSALTTLSVNMSSWSCVEGGRPKDVLVKQHD